MSDRSTAASRPRFYAATHRVWSALYDQGWTHSRYDDTLRSRVTHAVGDWRQWYDWGHAVMWLTGRYDGGSAGVPRGRDMWWIPVDYVEGAHEQLLAAVCEVKYGCYITRDFSLVRQTMSVDWRIFDLQDDGRTVKIALYPCRPEHDGRLQPLPSWHGLGADKEMRLLLWWYLVQHKAKAQWFGLRPWAYYKALHAAVAGKVPFTCQQIPPKGSGGYSHWHCRRPKRHRGPHRFNNYQWLPSGAVRYVGDDD